MKDTLKPHDPSFIRALKVNFFLTKHRHIIVKVANDERKNLGPCAVNRVTVIEEMEMAGEN